MIFLNSASSAAALVFDLLLCTLTDTEGTRQRPESGIYFKICEKTQYLMKNLYLLSTINQNHFFQISLKKNLTLDAGVAVS